MMVAEAKNVTVIKGKLPQDIAHLGGHRAPTEGAVSRGIAIDTGASGTHAAGTGSTKRVREAEETGLSAEEKAERARREAARARVQARTAQAFGLE